MKLISLLETFFSLVKEIFGDFKTANTRKRKSIKLLNREKVSQMSDEEVLQELKKGAKK